MRDIASVIGDVLGMIPDDEKGLRAGLESIRRSSGFCAPEGMWLHWQRLDEVLSDAIGKPTLQWHKDVAAAVTSRAAEP